jgi:hypothetical protein
MPTNDIDPTGGRSAKLAVRGPVAAGIIEDLLRPKDVAPLIQQQIARN